MNLWRWLGLGLFLVVAVLFINSVRLPVAGAQDKGDKDKVDDKTVKKEKADDKTPPKDKADDKTVKKEKADDKTVKKEKADDKTEKKEKADDKGVKPEVKGGGEKLRDFSAVRSKGPASFYRGADGQDSA